MCHLLPLLPPVGRVELLDLAPGGGEVRHLPALLPAPRDGAVVQPLVVVRHAALRVEVPPPHLLGLQLQPPRDLLDPGLHYHHPLRPAEPAERGVGGQVGLAAVAANPGTSRDL